MKVSIRCISKTINSMTTISNSVEKRHCSTKSGSLTLKQDEHNVQSKMIYLYKCAHLHGQWQFCWPEEIPMAHVTALSDSKMGLHGVLDMLLRYLWHLTISQKTDFF